ncbi:(R,R)-butanediol dehydrogenase / meso-butanediol dehydrogenase / diacetyl reductase [Sphingobium faniae]|nr:(R,R)-butanediol dehydrogenase / meso-butanediol dehydrogenase / diacetyl reductase [Sphingobium faniae]
MMKAAVFRNPGQPLVVEEVPLPAPGRGAALIRVARCGICGSDLHFTERHAQTAPSGTILGHEYAGEVVALGAGCERLRVGDRVIAMPIWGCGSCGACRADRPIHCIRLRPMLGGFAEYALIGEAVAHRLPALVSFADGALVEPLASALHGVRIADVKAGDHVLVLGAGAIAAGAIFWARRMGAARIVVLARSSTRASLVRHLGADAFIEDAGGDLELVHDVLGGPPDIILECTGASGMIERAIGQVRPMGRVVSLGMCLHRDAFVPATAQAKEIELRFAYAYGARAFRDCLNLFDSGDVAASAMVTGMTDLAGLPETFEAQRAGGSGCKVQLGF